MSNFYVTTAIPYVNGAPHIGHALDYLLADICARYHKNQGDTVRFQAGTDEHGNKIYQKAITSGLPVEEYVANNSQKFQTFIARLGVEYTDFIRTTDHNHVQRVQQIWTKLQPHIYKHTYQGWYCEGCERFVTDKEYAENQGVCPDHAAPYQKLSEENYYLRIADFKTQIQAAIANQTMLILPKFRQKEILRLIEDTPDVSISRPKKQLSWGVPIPSDDTQVMYVWIDALANYLTVLGYPDQEIANFWPADVQFVGKDILRFHAIIWPAILLGLGLPLPKVIHSHGFILSHNQKMSKSIGNVIDPLEVLDRHGVDAFRYFFSRHIDAFADSDFTWEKFEDAYNNELANDLGNLVQRLATLCHKNQVSGQPDFQATNDSVYHQLMQNNEFTKAIDHIWQKIQNLNKRIDFEKPWAVAKTNPAAAQKLLTSLGVDLLQISALLSPFLPATAQKITQIFTIDATVTPTEPLFPKL